jgi:uncharacterized repeat protein (TIGR03803 family)
MNPLQQRISKIALRAATVTLALVVVLGLVATQSAQAQTFSVLYNFTGSSDGAYPYAGVVRDNAGNLYSTTEGGGSGYGVVFKVDSSGTETVLYSFSGGSDGANPFAGLVRDAAGNLYGTTAYGGSTGVGTVFKVDTSGAETVLYSFTGGTADGCYPFGGLLRDKAGNLYGTTEVCGASGIGTVFEVSKTGKETVLHSFNGGSSDGCDIFGTPAMDKAGNLYGTANACGAAEAGMMWKVSKKGKETVLHNFAGGSSDGSEPIAGVIMDAKGNLYGDTYQGGPSNLGTAYELNKKGTLTLLHTFAGSDGSYLYGGVIRDAAGNLYGTSLYGGSGPACNNGGGTVWQITK